MNRREADRLAGHIVAGWIRSVLNEGSTFRDSDGNPIAPGSPDDRRVLAAIGRIVGRLDETALERNAQEMS